MPAPPPPPEAGSGSQPGARRPRSCPKVTHRPLPDPAAVQLRTVPDTAPPYDDELLPPPPPAASTPPPPPDRHPPATNQPTPQIQPAADRPAFASQFAQVLVESLAGTRPPRQLATWTTERARSRIQRMGPLLTAGHRPQLRRVVAYRPAPDVIEMTVIIAVGPRTKAVAIRLEHIPPPRAAPGRPERHGRWICTDIEAA
jgi:Family of unknown function (DUF6459)